MREKMVQEALRRLAAEAATRFTSLVATGEELPFDVAENSGEHTFYRYVPLTGRFVRAHADELRSLPAFGPACSAIDMAGVAASYLEARGEPVPADAVERAQQMLVAFIARLWEGSAEFTLERPRLEAALCELEAEARDVSEADVLIAPLIGLQMPIPRLDFPSGVEIVRADTVDAPPEATRSEGMQRSPWQPQFLVLAEQGPRSTGPAPAMRLLRELISVLRLFKEGGVGLAPYAFAPTGDGKWRRVATGVPATRPGGFKLTDAEAVELAAFARRLEARPDPSVSLAWAVARFEMGCDRPTALEGLSDHLLAMRALFECEGPAGASLPMRAAALIADPRERHEARERLQGAFELERALMAGRELDIGSAMGVAAWTEDATRAIVRGAALGEHGSDVAGKADETLVVAGLGVGEGSAEQMGETTEWEIPEAVDHPPDEIRVRAGNGVRGEEYPQDQQLADQQVEADGAPEEGLYYADDDYEDDAGYEEDSGSGYEETDDDDHEETTVSTQTERDWLSEVSQDDRGDTLEWPTPSGERARGERERERSQRQDLLETERGRRLFPVPDDTDWEVGELDYDRSRARIS